MKQLLIVLSGLFSLTLSAQNERVSYDESNNSIIFGNNRYEMVYVSGGSFNMGMTWDQKPDPQEKIDVPVHRVTLSSYYIGQTEVTQALWQAVMGNNPSYFRGAKRPVEQVNWKECQTFISRLNSMTGRNFCLPTEAQWEFAARGGNNSFHYKYSGSDNIENVAVYQANSLDRGNSSPDFGTHNVASRQPNELGIYDMSGNVGEWCSDMYGYLDKSPQTNPTGVKNGGSFRVWRGGCWQDRAGYCRSAKRIYNTYGRRNYGVGFRLALVPSSSRTKYVTDSRSSKLVQQKVNQLQPTTVSNATGSENGHGYVDLGLSVMWATCNLGANNPSEHGDYFAWGETRTKSDCDWSTLKYCLNSRGSKFSKYVTISNCGSIDNKTILDPEDDAAHVNWGGSWRMPTKAELEELLKKCTWTKTFQNGVEGRKVTGPNGNYIFLPATGQRNGMNLSGAGSYGYYWSSSLDTSYSGYAYYLGFSSNLEDWNYCYRYYGQYVRAVCP